MQLPNCPIARTLALQFAVALAGGWLLVTSSGDLDRLAADQIAARRSDNGCRLGRRVPSRLLRERSEALRLGATRWIGSRQFALCSFRKT